MGDARLLGIGQLAGAVGVERACDRIGQPVLVVGGAGVDLAGQLGEPIGRARGGALHQVLLAGGVERPDDPLTAGAAPLVAVAILVVAICLEGYSFRTAIHESRPAKGSGSWWQFIRQAKAPELPVVLLEDFGALIGLVLALLGVGLTVVTGNPVPGDLVGLFWHGEGSPGDSHVGIFESGTNAAWTAIEGNTGGSAAGGGAVMRRRRAAIAELVAELSLTRPLAFASVVNALVEAGGEPPDAQWWRRWEEAAQ